MRDVGLRDWDDRWTSVNRMTEEGLLNTHDDAQECRLNRGVDEWRVTISHKYPPFLLFNPNSAIFFTIIPDAGDRATYGICRILGASPAHSTAPSMPLSEPFLFS